MSSPIHANAPSRGDEDRGAGTITLLVCEAGKSATKTHRQTADGIETAPYNAGFLFRSCSIPAKGIMELSQILEGLAVMPDAFIIRGKIQPGVDPKELHQRTKISPGNYLTPQGGLSYVMIDVDKFPLSRGQRLSKKTIKSAIADVIETLPQELHNVSFHWQLSSSAGIKDDAVISVHLWFWLSKAHTDEELKRWAAEANAAGAHKIIDTALFNDVQAHYTAAPIFVGMKDPFPKRSGLEIKEQDCASLVIPSAPVKRVPICKGIIKKRVLPVGSSEYSTAPSGFEEYLSLIGDHAGGGGFHEPVLKAAASYVGTHGADGTDTERLYQILSDRVLSADATRHDLSDVEQRASRQHIMPAIEGALKKFGDNSAKSARVIEGVKPHYARESMPPNQAYKKLDSLISKMF